MLKKFLSRKLFALILIPIAMGLNAKLGSPLDPDAVNQLVYAVIAFIIGQAAVDTATTLKEK